MDSPLKRTPLFDAHVAAGARMVPFGGWEVHVQYTGIIEEHRTVRSAVGLFDVSHMGEFEVTGAQALAALQVLTTNDVGALEIGQVQYSLLCKPDGGIVDDLTLYRLAQDRYLMVVNAGNIDKDWTHVTTAVAAEGARWRNASAATGLIAVQGPRAEALVGRLADQDVPRIGYYRCARGKVAGVGTLISRTGYTGEDGFELYVDAGDTERLWNALLEGGRPDGVAPIGLGARDTLRLEMRYALYGNDIDETTNPLEAGLGWGVKPAKGDFVGRAPLEAVHARARVGQAGGRPCPRRHHGLRAGAARRRRVRRAAQGRRQGHRAAGLRRGGVGEGRVRPLRAGFRPGGRGQRRARPEARDRERGSLRQGLDAGGDAVGRQAVERSAHRRPVRGIPGPGRPLMRYLPNTAQNQRAMLETIGVRGIEDLLVKIPAKARLSRPLALPPALAESELVRHLRGLASKNADAESSVCFLGGGAYDHYTPSPINHLILRGEFFTAYTPYQPEASQGTLRTIYEYQTMIAELTGMDVANASIYDGASSLAEAALMAHSVTS